MSLHDHDEPDFSYLAKSNRPHSIDLTLELERQLDNESLPNSPAYHQTHSRPQSLDPHVLASIVTQLRLSVAELTRERDELSGALSEARTNENGLKETLHHVTEKCIRLETELTGAHDQHQEDTDAISMLRSKLEDSRRALMRLQTESRRMSQASNLSIDLSRANGSPFTGPPSSRRASFVPLTGSPASKINAHRRGASVADSSVLSAPVYSDSNQWASPPRFALSDAPQTANAAPSRRMSGFWGRVSPQPSDLPPPADASEIEELRKELQAVKEALEETRHELTESQEAREASETCVNALRTFIADNSIGMQGPSTAHSVMSPGTADHARNDSSGQAAPRWGFRLWSAAASPNPNVTPVSSPAQPSHTYNLPATSTTRSRFGSLFSSRASVSSTQTDSLLPQPESMSSVSDTSSLEDPVAEPISPSSEVPKDDVIDAPAVDVTPAVAM
ncbi:unnamed protein product [Somion occarium]|uniref:Uncharacterized protein n=1 Tax=Somion occarium TaxID=3059160 RepID=A0ABP1E4H9_9APHY